MKLRSGGWLGIQRGYRNMKSLKIAWWNSSLAPPTRPFRADKIYKETARLIINDLINVEKVDFIGLCEVNQDTIDFIQDEILPNNYSIQHNFEGISRINHNFDICVIYNHSRLDYCSENQENISVIRNGNTKKIAQRYDFSFGSDQDVDEFSFFLSHWPSLTTNGFITQAEHDFYAHNLAGELEKIRRKSESPKIILMGDYNLQPFDMAMTTVLNSTKDKFSCVKEENSILLFNPFWRFLSDKAFYNINNKVIDSISGSYYYHQDKMDRWKQFDQILFSNAMLGKSEWHFNEEKTKIFLNESSDYLAKLKSNELKFDHFPIICEFERD